MFEVLLMGGLGNQLFQLAAGLSFSSDDTLLIDDLGKPRRNEQNLPELQSFTLPGNVRVVHIDPPFLISQKMLNYGIRIGARSKTKNIQIELIEKTSNLLKFLNRRKFASLKLSCGTGYDPEFSPSLKAINVGYFQSYKYLENADVMSKMMSLGLANPSRTFLALEEKINKSSPIIVHIRLGDYVAESSFGIPSKSYYGNGISLIDQNYSQSPIWVFSNEPSKALNFIPESYHSRVFLVPNEGLSSAETLELMRKGCSYVIANSTYSWWAAMLSYNRSCKVVAPSPWFLSGAIPNSICPTNWIQIAADF
jgi:hypothetical protein